MKIGTYYYPEQWPREQWERDFDNIAAMGLQIVHMAEFAWYSTMPAASAKNAASKRNIFFITLLIASAYLYSVSGSA